MDASLIVFGHLATIVPSSHLVVIGTDTLYYSAMAVYNEGIVGDGTRPQP
jgi:hypothetical protein